MNSYFLIGGLLTSIAAVIHIGCIAFGASWYRFFGAGEKMAILSEQGSKQPTIITSGIVVVLTLWAWYAFSAAGYGIKLPFIKLAIVTIASVFLLRGIIGFYFVQSPIGRTPEFWVWSSLICLLIGLMYALGLKQQWNTL
jgi:hypothetical protein